MSRSVFLSYSHKDEKWRERVLAPLQALSLQTGSLDPWVDTRIEPGADWHAEIVAALNRAGAAVLLISNNFLASPFIRREEVARFLERRANEGLPIYAVLVEPCPWKKIPWLARMQVITHNGKSLAELTKAARQNKLARLAERIDDTLTLGRARDSKAPRQDTASGTGSEAPTTLARRTQELGDGEPLLYTFYGLKPPSDPSLPSVPSVGVSSVLRLWADPSHEGNWIRTALRAEDELDFFCVRFSTEPGSFPCDVTLRPCGFQPLRNSEQKPFLVFEARGARIAETPDAGFTLGLSVRLADRHATQWRKGEDATDSIDLPLDERWYSIYVDLQRRWTLFASDGNYRYALGSLDSSLIAALVVEFGGLGGPRLGAGAARVDLANIRLADAPSDKDLRGRLHRSAHPVMEDSA